MARKSFVVNQTIPAGRYREDWRMPGSLAGRDLVATFVSRCPDPAARLVTRIEDSLDGGWSWRWRAERVASGGDPATGDDVSSGAFRLPRIGRDVRLRVESTGTFIVTAEVEVT